MQQEIVANVDGHAWLCHKRKEFKKLVHMNTVSSVCLKWRQT